MTRIIVKDLVWTEYNVEHIKKHGVSREEVIEAVKKITYHKKTYNKRYLIVGRTGKRIVSVVVHRKEKGIYYVVTARDAEKKERKRVYEKEKSK